MTESPYLTTQQILMEPANLFDDLRIIAGSARLDKSQRALIRAAADELEQSQRLLLETQARLIEAQSRAIALHDRLTVVLPLYVNKACQPMSATLKIEGWSTK